MACQGVLDKNHNNTDENTDVKQDDEEDRTKECSSKNSRVADKTAEMWKKEFQSDRGRVIRKTQLHSLSRCSSHVVWWCDIVFTIYSKRNGHRNDRDTYQYKNNY